MRKVEFEPYIFSDNAEIYVIRIDNDPYSEFKKFFVRFNSSDDDIHSEIVNIKLEFN